MKILCSCCKDPLVRGDENNPPADKGIGIDFLTTRIFLYDEISEEDIYVEEEKTCSPYITNYQQRIRHTVFEKYGLVWNEEDGFWHMPDGRTISSGLAGFPSKGTSLCILRDGKAKSF